MSTIHQEIESIIRGDLPGKIYFVEDFIEYSNAENIKKILLRLTNQKKIERIAHGIYLKPKIHPEFGIIQPSIETIAQEIAKRDKTRIAPTGVYALYLLGLTTQVPLKTVFLTDGSKRIINISGQTITFKNTVPKTFAIENKLLHLIVQAFKEIGKENISEDFLSKIKKSILKLQSEVLKKELKFAPVWIQEHVSKIYKTKKNVD